LDSPLRPPLYWISRRQQADFIGLFGGNECQRSDVDVGHPNRNEETGSIAIVVTDGFALEMGVPLCLRVAPWLRRKFVI
jgi:hypothetical protein